jgi:hypothetical protein
MQILKSKFSDEKITEQGTILAAGIGDTVPISLSFQ